MNAVIGAAAVVAMEATKKKRPTKTVTPPSEPSWVQWLLLRIANWCGPARWCLACGTRMHRFQRLPPNDRTMWMQDSWACSRCER